jgi:hypothetical protein
MGFDHPLPADIGSSGTVNQGTKQLSLNCHGRLDDRLLNIDSGHIADTATSNLA